MSTSRLKATLQRFQISRINGAFSLLRLLTLELNLEGEKIEPIDPHIQQQLIDFIKVPYKLETFMLYGLLLCWNSFLTFFTLVPLKLIMNLWSSKINKPQFKRDLYTLSLVILSVWILSLPQFDVSRLYHDVRGSAHIKLYVMFGVLEVADKLFSSLGMDLLKILYSSDNMQLLPIIYILSVIYLTFHGYILIYQCVSLNVAANSYSNALLALLLSNQFSELKSSVFKKFEREGLFQISMADLAERFQLSLMLGIITLRNIVQLLSSSEGIIPNSWASWNLWSGAILGPGVVVIGSEIFVDWLKHCYISKFNRIRPRVYTNFLYVISLDYLELFKSMKSLTDHAILTKRFGLPLLALIVCFLRMTLYELRSVFYISSSIPLSIFVVLLAYIGLLLLRLVTGMILLKWAHRIKVNQAAYRLQSQISKDGNLFTPQPQSPSSPRSPVVEYSFVPGVPNTESSSINPKTRSYLYDSHEIVPPTPEEKRNKQLESENNLDDALVKVERYEMSSKRIW